MCDCTIIKPFSVLLITLKLLLETITAETLGLPHSPVLFCFTRYSYVIVFAEIRIVVASCYFHSEHVSSQVCDLV